MSSDIRRAFREVFEEVIHIYRNKPCFWHVKNNDYHNREKKNAAQNKSVEKLMAYDLSTDREQVVKKINSIKNDSELTPLQAYLSRMCPIWLSC